MTETETIHKIPATLCKPCSHNHQFDSLSLGFSNLYYMTPINNEKKPDSTLKLLSHQKLFLEAFNKPLSKKKKSALS